MIKKIYSIFSFAILGLVLAGTNNLHASGPYFNIPDEVCYGHEIIPEDVVESNQYSWTFCLPNLENTPDGYSQIPQDSYEKLKSIQTGKYGDQLITYSLNHSGRLVRTVNEEGDFLDEPSEVTTLFSVPKSTGFHLVKYEGDWHIFLIGNQGVGIQLTRLDFPNGLDEDPIIGSNKILNATQMDVKELLIEEDIDGQWYGFTFTQDDEILRLTFGEDLRSNPNLQFLGNPNNLFSNPVDVQSFYEDNAWYLFVVNKESENLTRVNLGSALSNPITSTNLGDFGGRLRRPTGISFIRSCEANYAFVVNEGSGSIVQLIWNNTSIANMPTAHNRGNMANMLQPSALSNVFIDEMNRIFLLAGNNDKSMSFIYFDECASVVYDDETIANPTFKYLAPGTYTVTLHLEDGSSYCKNITIIDRPDINISNDTMICQGDTITLSAISYGSEYTEWSPDYNISATNGQIVTVHPEFSTVYHTLTYFDDLCQIKNEIEVKVSRIAADAGEDRIIKDGSTTIIGGPNTSIGDEFTYWWTPDIGIQESRETPVTRVEPPYNTTYYLNVTNTDGCHSIDSVLVIVPCDDIHLPNAFTPDGQNPSNKEFGLKNHQIAKLNYFAVYDRWGNEVFYTEDPNEKWDGQHNGVNAGSGVYVWQVDGYCANTQERYRKSGNVTLIR